MINISSTQRKRLLNNWGDRAECMDCHAIVRVYDSESSWECYIYAMNPEYPDEIKCLIRGFDVEASDWLLSELSTLYNRSGSSVEIDTEYRPQHLTQLRERLNGHTRTER
jgi:hypothetical protein